MTYLLIHLLPELHLLFERLDVVLKVHLDKGLPLKVSLDGVITVSKISQLSFKFLDLY